MRLRGVEFGHVFCASGARGFGGEGYLESAVAGDDRESIRLYAPELLRRFNGVDAALARMTADYLAACKETYEVRAELQRLRGEGAR